MLSSSAAAYGTSPVQVQSFGNMSLPKETKSIGGHSYAGARGWREECATELKKLKLEIEREIEEQRKMMLAKFLKAHNSIIKKVATPRAMPSISDLLSTEVKQSNEDLAHLINAPPYTITKFRQH